MVSMSKKYCFILFLTVIAMLSGCSVDNKNIPEPGGNINVDTSGTLGIFYLNVTGDSSYLLTVIAVDTVVQDSLVVLGADAAIRDEIVFSTSKAVVGTYYTEQSPPGITGGYFLFRKKIASGYKNYLMLHGKIVIASIDASSGVIRGSIDVNNEYVTTADKLYKLKGNFQIKLNN